MLNSTSLVSSSPLTLTVRIAHGTYFGSGSGSEGVVFYMKDGSHLGTCKLSSLKEKFDFVKVIKTEDKDNGFKVTTFVDIEISNPDNIEAIVQWVDWNPGKSYRKILVGNLSKERVLKTIKQALKMPSGNYRIFLSKIEWNGSADMVRKTLKGWYEVSSDLELVALNGITMEEAENDISYTKSLLPTC